MTLALGVETSSRFYGVVVVDGTETVAEVQVDRMEPDFVDVGVLAADALASAGHRSSELQRLAVDVGPGNLASVRAGIAYVNALAYALRIPVIAADSLGLLVGTVREHGWDGPVLALRAGGGSRVYAGLRGEDGALVTRYGPLDEVVPKVIGDLTEVVVCGVAREQVAAVLARRVRVLDSDVEVPRARALVPLLTGDGPTNGTGAVSPLTEHSAPFRG